jgi:hypothetical protein
MARPIRFLSIWFAALLVLLVVASAVNVFVNPYDLFPWQRIAGINEFKPRIRDHAFMTKLYQIERAQPVTAILGTSRAYLGMDSKSPAWPASFQPVYNYGIPGTSMGRSLFRELREAASIGPLRHVVVILDVPSFFVPDNAPAGGEDDARLRLLDDGSPNPGMREQRLRDMFLSVFTMSALVDSVRTVLAQSGGDRVLTMRPDGTANDADFAEAARGEGMHSVFAQKDEFDVARIPGFRRTLPQWHGPLPNIGFIQEMIQFCLQHNISMTLILGSSHADEMELYRRAGLWPYVEQLKIDLATIVDQAHSDSITAWDFVEYAPYTTEHLPPMGDRTTKLHWFWEPVHFQRALGDLMLQRVFQGTPATFGAPLTLATVAARNQAVREQQQAFIGWHVACEDTDPQHCGPQEYGAIEAAR